MCPQVSASGTVLPEANVCLARGLESVPKAHSPHISPPKTARVADALTASGRSTSRRSFAEDFVLRRGVGHRDELDYQSHDGKCGSETD
jgi:hypothetical protein